MSTGSMLTYATMPNAKRGRKSDPSVYRHTSYGEWFRSAVDRTQMDLAELGRLVESDYNYMWQLYSGRKTRPGYNLAWRIGRVLGDIRGSLESGEWEISPDAEREIAEQEYMRLVLGDVDGKPVTLTISRQASAEDVERLKRAFHVFQDEAMSDSRSLH